MNHDVDNVNNKCCHLLAAVADTVFLSSKRKKFIVAGRSNRHCNPDYKSIVLKVTKLKEEKPALFTRMFQLSPEAFDIVLDIKGSKHTFCPTVD
jgi:hypothetical protein